MTDPTVREAGTDLVIAFADLVEQHYVLADLASDYAHRIRSNAARLASQLPRVAATNSVLHALVPDKHLGLREPRPAAPRSRADTPPGEGAAAIRWVEALAGGTSVVEISPLFRSPDLELPALRDAAHRVTAARALVLDLRRCHGGDPETAALIHGWLLGPAPVRLGRFEHRGRASVDYSSNPAVGTHFPGPVRVLTSAGTFSGGEDIAYVLQALGRARVVGERTGGGAHPVEHFPLPGGHTCQIPVARSVIDATGTNWESTGVRPDTECDVAQALLVAAGELAPRGNSGVLPRPGA